MRAYSTQIEDEAKDNEAFRRVLFTGKHMQLVVMSLNPGEEIGAEIHDDTDQFFRVEQGTAKFEFETGVVMLEDDSIIVVPAGMRHNVINPSTHKPLKLFTMYSPPEHEDGIVEQSKIEAEAKHTLLV